MTTTTAAKMSASTPMNGSFARHLNGHAAENGHAIGVNGTNGSTNGVSANGVSANEASTGFGPDAVGIVNLEVVFPRSYVEQSELEEYDAAATGAPLAGKYTKGLGQTRMGFCRDNEDVNSLALTAVARLVEKSGISYKDIGRLEVMVTIIESFSVLIIICLLY